MVIFAGGRVLGLSRETGEAVRMREAAGSGKAICCCGIFNPETVCIVSTGS